MSKFGDLIGSLREYAETNPENCEKADEILDEEWGDIKKHPIIGFLYRFIPGIKFFVKQIIGTTVGVNQFLGLVIVIAFVLLCLIGYLITGVWFPGK